MTSISPSLQQQLERLSPDQRSEVGALLAAMQDSAARSVSAPRQPGGLIGKMHTHADDAWMNCPCRIKTRLIDC